MRVAEPSLTLAQARARWGDGVVVAGLFQPGPNPEAKTALTRALTRRSNRRQADLPGRILVAVDDVGRALLCPVVADAQGGHPAGDDIYAGPFEELGAVAAGELSLVVLLDEGRPAVLEAVWLDRDAASVAALLTGEPLPDDVEREAAAAEEDEDAEASPYTETLLAQAEAAQARADALRALAIAAQAEEASATGSPLAPRPPGEEPRPPGPPAGGEPPA